MAVGLGLSFQLVSRGFSFRHGGGEGGWWKREEGEEAGKHALLIKLQARRNGLPRSQVSCLSDPQRRDEPVAQEGAQNSVKKVVHFGSIDRG